MLTIPREGLVAEYYLNGDGSDTSGNGNNGVCTDITWVDTDIGYQSKCGSFNGSSSKITVSDEGESICDYDADYTMCARIKSYGDTSDRQIIFSGQGTRNVEINIGDDNYIYNILYDGSRHFAQSKKPITFNKQTFVVGTRSKTEGLKIYINGILEGVDDFTGNADSTSNNDEFGCYNDTDSGFFNGEISLGRIYNRVLSEKEIQALYLEGLKKLNQDNNTIPELFKGCVAYYDFRGGDLHNIRTGDEATNNGATPTTDHLRYENNAYSFDGDNDLIKANFNLQDDTNYTFSIYTKIQQSSGVGCLISEDDDKGRHWLLYYNKDDDRFDFQNDPGSGWEHIYVDWTNDNNYHLITVNINTDKSVKLYLDGTLLGNGDVSEWTDDGRTNGIGFGANVEQGNEPYQGIEDYILIFNRALSSSEIKTLYNLLMK